jgi:hypothetical protein
MKTSADWAPGAASRVIWRGFSFEADGDGLL